MPNGGKANNLKLPYGFFNDFSRRLTPSDRFFDWLVESGQTVWCHFQKEGERESMSMMKGCLFF